MKRIPIGGCRHPYGTRYRLRVRFLRSFYPSGRTLLSEGGGGTNPLRGRGVCGAVEVKDRA